MLECKHNHRQGAEQAGNKAYAERLALAKEALARAEHIVIGGGAGLSAAAGLDYGAERFAALFADFKQKYHIADLYSAMFYPFRTEEELWAHHARHILVNRYVPVAASLYRKLAELVVQRDHFVITTNVDSQFQKAGFAPERIFEVQGNYAYLQCAKACHDTLYHNETLIRKMVAETVDCRVPRELVPRCPVCGGAMDIHIRTNDRFVQNDKWEESARRYEEFLARAAEGAVVYLELGLGFNTPGIIRYPFERMTERNASACLLRLNRYHPESFAETARQTISFNEDMGEVIGSLC